MRIYAAIAYDTTLAKNVASSMMANATSTTSIPAVSMADLCCILRAGIEVVDDALVEERSTSRIDHHRKIDFCWPEMLSAAKLLRPPEFRLARCA